MKDVNDGSEVIIPPQGRVPAEREAELWNLAGQVEAVLRLAGLPAQVAKEGADHAGAVIMVDCSLSGAGVFVMWRSSDALYEAGRQARQRRDLQDPAHRWYAEVIADVMPEAVVRVLRSAGLRVTVDDPTMQVEGPIPGYLRPLIEG